MATAKETRVYAKTLACLAPEDMVRFAANLLGAQRVAGGYLSSNDDLRALTRLKKLR